MATHFSNEQRADFYDILHARRDMRHFQPNSQVAPEVLARILQAAHSAPSVGLMQPWHFIRITEQAMRDNIAMNVEQERQQTAALMSERKSEFLRLKVEGVKEAAELLVVVQRPDDGTVFGRRTLPEMALCSVACAIENAWLAARAENLGMGWVSIFDPKSLAATLDCPEGAKPIAILCLGPVKAFYDKPMLVEQGWREAQPLSSLFSENTWSDA